MPNIANSTDKRRGLRKSAIQEQICLVELSGGRSAMLLDVSELGIGVQCVEGPMTESTTSVRFVLPGGSTVISGAGQIAWSDHTGCMGIRFTNIAAGMKNEITKWVTTESNPFFDNQPEGELLVEQDARDRVAQLEARILVSGWTQVPALNFLVDQVAAMTQASGVAIAVEDGKGIVCKASSGIAPQVGVRINSRSGLSWECTRTGDVVNCVDTETDPRVDRMVCRELNMRSAMLVPVKKRERVTGLVEVFSSRPRAFNPNTVVLLKNVAEAVAGLDVFTGFVEEPLIPPPAEIAARVSAPPTPPPPVAKVPSPAPAIAQPLPPPAPVAQVRPPAAPVTQAAVAQAAKPAAPSPVPSPVSKAAAPAPAQSPMPTSAPVPVARVTAPVNGASTAAAPKLAPAAVPVPPTATTHTAVKPAPIEFPKPLREVVSVEHVAQPKPPVQKINVVPTPVAASPAVKLAAATVAAPAPVQLPVEKAREATKPAAPPAQAPRPVLKPAPVVESAPEMFRMPEDSPSSSGFALKIGIGIAAALACAGLTYGGLYWAHSGSKTNANVSAAPPLVVAQPVPNSAAAAAIPPPVVDKSGETVPVGKPISTGSVPPARTSVPIAVARPQPRTSTVDIAEASVPVRTAGAPDARRDITPVSAAPLPIAPPNSASVSSILSGSVVAPTLDRPQVSQGVTGGEQVKRVEPRYPPAARNLRIAGLVVLRAHVSKTGNVTKVDVISGSPMLATAASDAVRQWRYRPFVLDGLPIENTVTVQVKFTAPQ